MLTLLSGFVFFSLTEPTNQKNSIPGSQPVTIQPENHRYFWTVVSVFVFITHVWNHGCFRAPVGGRPRHDRVKQTHLDHWKRLLLDSPAQYYGRGTEQHWSDAQNLPQSEVIGVNWQHRPRKAKHKDCFLHPSERKKKKRLNSTFHFDCQILSKLHVMMLFSFWT